MKSEKSTDAVVDMNDALRWAKDLVREDPDDVIQRVLNTEPFALGFAINTAHCVAMELAKQGLPPAMIEIFINKSVLSSAVAIELMQKGFRQLWSDFVDPVADPLADKDHRSPPPPASPEGNAHD